MILVLEMQSNTFLAALEMWNHTKYSTHLSGKPRGQENLVSLQQSSKSFGEIFYWHLC